MVRKSLLLLMLVFAAIVSLTLVSAAITVEIPVAGNNYTTTLNIYIKYANATADMTDALSANTTCYYNVTGTWATVGILSSFAINATGFNATIDIGALTDSTGLSFNCSVGNVTTITASNTIDEITFDSTPPNVSTFYNTLVNGNYSGNIVLNVSVNDSTIGAESVYFNITNSSGQVNWTKASNPVGIYYNATFDTTSLGDGMYNITVYANDSLNNLNSSEKIQITIDNTAPTLSFSCSPSSVDQGDTVTCSCSGTDSTSGINTSYGTSGYSFTSTPSTSSSGTFILECSGKDYTGNYRTTTTSYTVAGVVSSRISTTITSWTSTYIVSDQKFAEGYTKKLSKKHRLRIKVSNETHYMGVTDLTSTTATISVSSTPQTATLSVGEEKKFDVLDDGYYDISVMLNTLEHNQADITIRSMHEEIPEEIPEEEEALVTEEVPLEEIPSEAPRSLLWLWILIIIVVVVIIVYLIYKKKKIS